MTGTEASYIFHAITTASFENFMVAAALKRKSDPICKALSESMLKEKKTPLLNSARYLLQLYNLPVAVPGYTVVFKMHMNYKHGLSGNIQELCVSDVLTQ